MAEAILGREPIDMLVERALQRLSHGEPPHRIEVERVDFKEERGKRTRDGSVALGAATNKRAAEQLAEEMACMANTPGGGAVIVGVSDDGVRIGTQLDADWLRHRIWELTSHQLTVSIREASIEGCRLLILTCIEALAPSATAASCGGASAPTASKSIP